MNKIVLFGLYNYQGNAFGETGGCHDICAIIEYDYKEELFQGLLDLISHHIENNTMYRYDYFQIMLQNFQYERFDFDYNVPREDNMVMDIVTKMVEWVWYK